MRSLFISFFSGLLLAACSSHHPAPVSDTSVPAELQSDFHHKVEAMSSLEKEADVVLEAQGCAKFRLLKPSSVSEQSAVGVNGYLHLISPRSSSGRGLVVLIVPEYENVQGTAKIMDEVILDVRDAAVKQGYQRFAVGAHAWGRVGQIYADGLPSREQVAKKKQSWKASEATIHQK